ncbi:hypothetical protein BJX63DRAFT_437859 [Aspergillus granulosus]|uniref:Uncharacterized protein n=1 Tax=Aspergillus granulosus TaxID=176169 RepID=A0ABR4GTP8_9EURO
MLDPQQAHTWLAEICLRELLTLANSQSTILDDSWLGRPFPTDFGTPVKFTVKSYVPSFEDIRKGIPWISQFTNLDRLESAALRWEAKQEEMSVTPGQYVPQSKATNVFSSVYGTRKHMGILEHLGPPEKHSIFEDMLPFSFVKGRLLGVSAFLGSEEMLQYWKQKLPLLKLSTSWTDNGFRSDFQQDEYIPGVDLLHAIERDDERATALLLENLRIDITHRRLNKRSEKLDPDNTPLIEAAKQGYHRVIKVLLRHP